MNRKLIIAALGLGLITFAGAASARGWGHVSVNLGVPYAHHHHHAHVHARVYTPVVTVAPARVSCRWVEGYWQWNGYEEAWVPGHCAHAAPVVYAPVPVGVSLNYTGRF